MPLWPAPMTIPSYSSNRSGMGSSLAARHRGRPFDLELQVFLDDLPGVAAGARRHRVGRVRGHADLVEPRDRRPVVGQFGERSLLAQLAGDLARLVDRPVA